MYGILIIVHVIACFVLIGVILLQAGRGGGLGGFLGSGEAVRSVMGTQAPAILKKATTISAIAFLMTSLVLGMITARKGRSLFQQGRMPVVPVAAPEASGTAPQMPAATQGEAAPIETVPAEQAKP